MSTQEIPSPTQTTSSGDESGTSEKLRLTDLPNLHFGESSNVMDATDEEFLNFIQTIAPLEGENLEHWTWLERRDFLNWAIDEGILLIDDGRLVPNLEGMVDELYEQEEIRGEVCTLTDPAVVYSPIEQVPLPLSP